MAITRVFNRETSNTYSSSIDGLSNIATEYDANGNPLKVPLSCVLAMSRWMRNCVRKALNRSPRVVISNSEEVDGQIHVIR